MGNICEKDEHNEGNIEKSNSKALTGRIGHSDLYM